MMVMSLRRRSLRESSVEPAREQLTLIRFEELRDRGYDGGAALRQMVGARNTGDRPRPYVRLSFAPGEAYQFDWSHEVVLLSGTTVMVKEAHVRLCHSRMLVVQAYPREKQEMVFDAHGLRLALFKSTRSRGFYDNLKTAVKTIFEPRAEHADNPRHGPQSVQSVNRPSKIGRRVTSNDDRTFRRRRVVQRLSCGQRRLLP